MRDTDLPAGFAPLKLRESDAGRLHGESRRLILLYYSLRVSLKVSVVNQSFKTSHYQAHAFCLQGGRLTSRKIWIRFVSNTPG